MLELSAIHKTQMSMCLIVYIWGYLSISFLSSLANTHSETERVSSETESESRCEAFPGESPLYLDVRTHYKPKSQEKIKQGEEEKK